MTLPGVGRKTANLVLILAFKSRAEHLRRHARPPHLEPARAGCATRTPEETEQALYRATDRALVAAHQPVSGHLGAERLPAGVSRAAAIARSADDCPKIGVAQERHERDSGSRRQRCWLSSLRCGSAQTERRSLRGAASRGAALRRRPARDRSPGAGPVIVVETVKGTFEFETYPNEAPEDRRAHRRAREASGSTTASASIASCRASSMQFGDPQTRDMTKRGMVGHAAAAARRSASPRSRKKRTHVQRRGGHGAPRRCRRRPTARSTSRWRRAATRRQVHGLRPGHHRHGRRRQAAGRRS